MRSYVFPGEQEFLDTVRRLRSIGFGRMIQIISREWYRTTKEEGFPSSGVTVGNTCLGLMTEGEQAGFEAGYRVDPLFQSQENPRE